MSADISDFLNPELLAFTPAATASGSGSSSSRESSPDSSWSLNQLLSTPPDAGYVFPSFSPPPTTSNGPLETDLFSFLNEPSSFAKLPPNPTDIFSSGAFDWLSTGFGAGGGGSQTIDPQLVAKTTPSAPKTVEQNNEEEEELTLTINPVKVGGHGKARKGTVQSGGVTKKTSPAASFAAATSPTSSTSSSKENKKATTKEEMDDDDMEDWRPSPEVLAKMTSKEKRQLRNKISARNFRVRRKEYISTLEMDIAERDRLLQAIRTELGSTQSENLALRQEIEALKGALLEGRSSASASEDMPAFNLPPPAPLPTLSPQLSSSINPSSLLFSPNMQKDLSLTSAFWGGFPSSTASSSLLFGGVTPVHTTIIPELSALARNVNSPQKQNENINPVMNYINSSSTTGFNKSGTAGFDGFADSNPFTMKTLDAYRMQLWTRMAQQHQNQQQPLSHHSPGSPSSSSSSSSGSSKGSPSSSPPPPLVSSPSMFTQPLPGGLAGSLRPSFFTNSNKINVVPSKTSPKLPTKAFSMPAQKDTETAYIASLASQTLFKKLGGAFWDAFSGGSSSASASSARTVDADKVRKVLEGKAVVKVVDVEPATATPKIPATTTPKMPAASTSKSLEESMSCLSLTGLGLKGR